MSKRIDELAVAKGNVKSANCEICGNKATTKCEECRVTHYCCQEHKQMDAISFHKNVCGKMANIRGERPLPFTELDRNASKEAEIVIKQEILSLAEAVTRQWLLERKPINAYPSAMIAWNTACDLNSPESKEVIYPACLVSEMFLNSGMLPSAEQYMLQASWNSQKYDTLPAALSSQIHRLRGLVLMAAEKWAEAREAFAEYVYAIAIEHGTKDIRIGIPFGLLGLSLLQFENIDGAMDSFHRMADKWLRFLVYQFKDKTMRKATHTEMASDKNIQELEFQYMEAKIVCEWVYEAVRKLGMDATTDLINFKIVCFQAMCHMKENSPKDAIVFKEEALAIATRTKQDKAVPYDMLPLLRDALGDDFLLRWEKEHNRPKTCGTKYLEMIQAMEF